MWLPVFAKWDTLVVFLQDHNRSLQLICQSTVPFLFPFSQINMSAKYRDTKKRQNQRSTPLTICNLLNRHKISDENRRKQEQAGVHAPRENWLPRCSGWSYIQSIFLVRFCRTGRWQSNIPQIRDSLLDDHYFRIHCDSCICPIQEILTIDIYTLDISPPSTYTIWPFT